MASVTITGDTAEICMEEFVPNINNLYGAMKTAVAGIEGKLFATNLPLAPAPIYQNLSIPTVEYLYISSLAITSQYNLTLLRLVEPILSKLGIDIDSWMPKLPILNLGLLDLVSLDANAVLADIKNHIAIGTDFSVFDIIPIPLYDGLNIPEHMALHYMQSIMNYSSFLMFTPIYDIIDQVSSVLEIGFSLSIPTVPSYQDVLNLMLSFTGAADYAEMLKQVQDGDFTLEQIISGISIPSFTDITAFVFPVFDGFTSIEMELRWLMDNMFAAMYAKVNQILYDYVIDKLASLLSFSFELLCFNVGSSTQTGGDVAVSSLSAFANISFNTMYGETFPDNVADLDQVVTDFQALGNNPTYAQMLTSVKDMLTDLLATTVNTFYGSSGLNNDTDISLVISDIDTLLLSEVDKDDFVTAYTDAITTIQASTVNTTYGEAYVNNNAELQTALDSLGNL